MQHKGTFIVSAVILMAFITGMFAGIASGQVTTFRPEQVEAVQEDQGPDAPYGSWQQHLEETLVYLHSDTPVPVEETDAGSVPIIPNGNEVTDGYFDYERPAHPMAGNPVATDPDPENKRVNIRTLLDGEEVQTAEFDMMVPDDDDATAANFSHDLRIYRLDGYIKADCSGEQGGIGNQQGEVGTEPFVAEFWRLRYDDEAGTWETYNNNPFAEIAFSAQGIAGAPVPSDATGMFTYVGETSGGNPALDNGWRLPAGERVRVVFAAADETICILAYDTYEDDDNGNGSPAWFRIVADTARINTWVEDQEGEFTKGLPSPETAPEADRHFQVQAAHASVWPDWNMFKRDKIDPFNYQAETFTRRHFQDPAHSNGDSIGNSEEKWIRVRDTDADKLEFDERTDNPDTLNFPNIRPEPVDFETRQGLFGADGLTDSVNLVTWRFQYTRDLPEAKYQVEIYSETFGISISPTVSVGLRSFELSEVDGLVHEVNPQQRTMFRLLIENTGGDDDTYTITPNTPPGQWGWEVLNQRVSVSAGGEAEVVAVAVPPETAPVGTSEPLSVTVSSSVPSQVPSQTFTWTVDIVDGGSAAVDLFGAPDKVEIFPGQQLDIAGLRVHNQAPFEDTYVFNVAMPSDLTGWSTKVTPPSRTVPAASIQDLSVTLRAPASADVGESFDINVQAIRLGATGVADDVTIPVDVVLVRDLELDLLPTDDKIVPRQDAEQSEGCVYQNGDHVPGSCIFLRSPLAPHDPSSVFRVQITNPSPVEDTFSVAGQWTAGGDFEARGLGQTCDDDGDDNPDLWRMEFGDAEDVAGSPSVRSTNDASERTSFGTVTVPPMTTVYRYLEIGYLHPHVDSQEQRQSLGDCEYPWAQDPVRYNLRFQSQHDPTLVRFAEAEVEVGPPGTIQRGVQIERDIAQDAVGAAHQRASGTYAPTEYRFRLVNTANHPDTLSVSVPLPGSEFPGWTQHIEWVSNDEGGQNPSGVTCTSLTEDDRRWRCGMGVFDEATLKVVVQPPASERVGRQYESQIRVFSVQDSRMQDELAFATETVGLFSFDVDELKPLRRAAPGSDVSLPFEIENTGTEGDNYVISILDGDANWSPRFSSDQEVFIPGLHSHTGFLMVSVPEGAAVGSSESFRVQVDAAGAEIQAAEFEVEVIAPGELSVSGDPSNSVLLSQRGVANTVDVVARSASGPEGEEVRFEVDAAALPPGWSVSPDSTLGSDPDFEADDGSDCPCIARTTFEVTPPADALATSRVPLLVTATTQDFDEDDRRTASQDVILSLESDAGIDLDVTNDNPGTVLPGGTVTFNVDVLNDALAADTVDLSHTQLPEGWGVEFQPAEIGLGPLERSALQVTVRAPVDADAGDNVTLTLFGTSRSDPTVFDALDLWSVVGFTDLNLTIAPETQYVGPDETISYVVDVNNTGNLPDDVLITASVLTDSLAGDVAIQSSPRTVEVGVNATRQTLLEVSTSTRVPAGASIPIEVTGTSQNNPASAPVTDTFEIEAIVLDYKAIDVDSDSINEFAVDRNRDASDGFEEFKESRTPGGKESRLAQIERFLSDEAREQYMVQVPLPDGNTTTVFRLFIDGDGDGRADHFVDDSGDGLPNAYWDPDREHSHRLTVFKDVDADNVVDYFVDVDGDDQLDKVFNVVTGTFTDLIVRDIDGDTTLDYVVDADGDGEVDADETVLFTRGGQLIAVQKVDVDGDGELDEVYDVDGDGKPDYFIRNGETESRPLTLKDVNGDGVEDWLYDSNLDGKDDSYYDPASRQGGQGIDSQASFIRMAGEYWYIPALFALVVVLFIVLVAVTRR